MNGKTVKSTAHLVTSLALRHVAQRHGGAHRGWSALAAAFFTATAIAGNNVFQQGAADGDGDYLASNSANWGQPGQVSTDGATGETTITEMSFSNPYVTTFDKLIKTTTYCWIGATDGAYDADDAWCVWRTKGNSSEYGFTQSGNNHVVMADASTQKGRLRIESGTYTAQTFQIGGKSGTAYLDVSNATLRATGDFRVASYDSGSTKGYVTIRDGAVVTAGANIAIGTESGVTADMTVTNATLSAASVLYVGRGSIGTGTLRVEKDATVHTDGDILIGSNGGTGTLVVDGGEVSTKFWFPTCRDGTGGFSTNIVNAGSLLIGTNGNGCFELSCVSGSYTYFEQNGGYVHAPGSTNSKDGTSGYGMYIGRAAGASADVVLKSGEMVINGDVNVGDLGTGTLTIQDDGYMTVGVATAHKWMRIKNSSTVNLNGGVLDICHVEYPDGSGRGTINFDGGAIHAYANNANCGGVVIGASDNLTVNVKAGGATFDIPSGVAVSIAEPLLEDSNSTGGGVTKTGKGTLTLASGNTYTGTTTVSEGTLVLGTGTYGAVKVEDGTMLTVPAASAPSAITIAERGLVLVDVSSLELTTDAETAINLANITLPEGAKDPALYVAPKGQKAVFTFTQSGSAWTLASAHLAAEGESVVNVYLGNNGTGSGEWRTTGQWSLGAVPTSVDTAIFVKDGTLTDNVADTVAPSNIVLKTSRVKFIGGNKWPKIRAQEINGIEGATIVLSCYGLGPTTDKNLAVSVNIDIDTDTKTQDCWIEGNGETSRIAFYGGFYATNSAFRVNQDVDFYGSVVCGYTSDDDNYFKDRVYFKNASSLEVESGGTVELRGVVFESGSVVKGSGIVNMTTSGSTIAANISDALTLNLTGGASSSALYTRLSGDNSAFTGTLNSSGYHICVLDTINSASADATWNISTDFRYEGSETGTLKFGALNLSKVDWCYFYITKGLEGLVVEVGAKNEDMTWGSGYCFGTYSSGAASTTEFTDALIRKVGTGALYIYADHYSTIEMACGIVAMQDSHGPGTAFVWTGGTLRFDAAYNWDPTGRFDFTKSTAAIDIDTAGNSFIWGTAFAGANDLVKRGEGTLHLTGAHTYTGATKVLGGELILPYRDLGSAAIEVAEGAELALDMSGATIAEGTPTSFGVAADDGTKDRIVFSGADWAFTVARDEATGALSYTAASNDDTVPNRWIGGAAGSWSLAGNWSRGLPTATQTVLFERDATITLDSTKTVSNLVNNAYVQFRTTDNVNTHPTLAIREVNGTGTNALWHAGIIATGLPGTIAAETTVEILDCPAWKQGTGWYTADSWLEGDYEASPLKIYGNICGNGYLICRDYVYFYGDTSGHTANVLMEQAGQKHFCSTTSGFPSSARLEIQGTATVDCMDGVTFGALNIAEWNGYLGFDVPEGFEGTIKVGANNKDATIGNTMSFFEILNAGGWNTGCAAATLEKIGSGTLRCGIQNACKIQVTEGTVEFTAANMAADITVAAGATLSGTTDQTVKSVKFEDGAYYRLTSNSLTATTIEFGKNVYLYLNEADRVKAAAGTVLSGNVTGSPMATVLNEAKTGIAACNDDGWYWTASKEEPGVKLVSAQVAATTVATGAETSVVIRDADLAAWLEAKGAADKVNEANDNGVTGILAYMLGEDDYTDAAKPTMGAEIADGVATLTFDDSAFRRVPGLKLAYYLESCDKADFSEAVTTGEPSDDPAVALELATAKLYNRLCADVRASE